MIDEEEDENVGEDGDLSGKLKDLDFRFVSSVASRNSRFSLFPFSQFRCGMK